MFSFDTRKLSTFRLQVARLELSLFAHGHTQVHQPGLLEAVLSVHRFLAGTHGRKSLSCVEGK